MRAGKKTLEARKLIKGLMLAHQGFVGGLKPWSCQNSKRVSETDKVWLLRTRINTLKSSEAYERSHVEITHDRIQRKLSVKRSTKTWRRDKNRLDADSVVSLWILNTLKGTKPHERLKHEKKAIWPCWITFDSKISACWCNARASQVHNEDSMKGQRPWWDLVISRNFQNGWQEENHISAER